MFSSRFWDVAVVSLWILLLQNCQPYSASIIEEEKPAVYSLSAPAVSAMRQCASSEPLAMWSLTFSSVSPVAPISPSRLTILSNREDLSTASFTRSLAPFATGAAVGNFPAVPHNPPAAAMSRASRAAAPGKKPGCTPSPLFTASSGERMRFKQHDGQWCAVLVPGTSLNEQEHTLPVVSSGNIGALLSSLQGQDAWSSRSRIHVLATPTAPYSPCVYVGKVGLLGGAPASPGQGERQEPYTKFGKEEWGKYFGGVGEEPALPADMEATLDAPCPFWESEGKKVRDTHLLVLIPAKVDGKPFTLNLLGELIRRPGNDGCKAKYGYYHNAVKTQIGDNPPASSYWVLMTQEMLPRSLGKSYSDQKKLIADYASRTGLSYQFPKTLEAATAILAHYVRTEKRLYSDEDNPMTYARCQELIDKRYAVDVGGFSPSGLVFIHNGYGNRNAGVVGRLRVSVPKELSGDEPARGSSSDRLLECSEESSSDGEEMSINEVEDTESVFKRPPSNLDLDSSSLKRSVRVSDGGQWKQGNVCKDVLSTLLAMAGSESNDKSVRLFALKTLREAEWVHYFGEVGLVPDLPKNTVAILDRECLFWPPKRVKDTHLLVLIPAKVNGEPFTLNQLGKLIKDPKNGGHKTQYRFYNGNTQSQVGNEAPASSYWLLLTRDVLPGSRDKTYAAQKAIVADASRSGMNYELPKALEAATAILAHYVRTGERLYSDAPLTYTRCQELIRGNYGDYPSLVGGFGGFDPLGLRVNYHRDCGSCHDGVAGCRKF